MLDTHLHLDDPKLADNAENIITDCEKAGIEFVINNSCDMSSMLASVALADRFKRVFATVGMHPHDSKSFDDAFVAKMTEFATHPKVVAVGEIGLDYFYDLSDRATQRDVFAAQIELADSYKLPLQLHIRDAYGDAWDMRRAVALLQRKRRICASGCKRRALLCIRRSHHLQKCTQGGGYRFRSHQSCTFRNGQSLSLAGTAARTYKHAA